MTDTRMMAAPEGTLSQKLTAKPTRQNTMLTAMLSSDMVE